MSVNVNKTLSLMPGILAFGKFQGVILGSSRDWESIKGYEE